MPQLQKKFRKFMNMWNLAKARNNERNQNEFSYVLPV